MIGLEIKFIMRIVIPNELPRFMVFRFVHQNPSYLNKKEKMCFYGGFAFNLRFRFSNKKIRDGEFCSKKAFKTNIKTRHVPMRKCQCLKKKNIKKSHGKPQRQILAKLTRQIPTQKIQNKFPHREPPPRASLKMPTACWYGQPCNNKPKHKKRKNPEIPSTTPSPKMEKLCPNSTHKESLPTTTISLPKKKQFQKVC